MLASLGSELNFRIPEVLYTEQVLIIALRPGGQNQQQLTMSRAVVSDAFVFLAKMRKVVGFSMASGGGARDVEESAEVDPGSPTEVQPLLHQAGKSFLG